MTKITIDPTKLNAIKDEVFARLVEQNTNQAIKDTLLDYANNAIFRFVNAPEVLTEPDEHNEVWVGNEYIRVKVYYEHFLKDVETELASQV